MPILTDTQNSAMSTTTAITTSITPDTMRLPSDAGGRSSATASPETRSLRPRPTVPPPYTGAGGAMYVPGPAYMLGRAYMGCPACMFGPGYIRTTVAAAGGADVADRGPRE